MSSKPKHSVTVTSESIVRPATATSKGGTIIGSISVAELEKVLKAPVGSCWIQNGFVCFQQKNAAAPKANAIQLG